MNPILRQINKIKFCYNGLAYKNSVQKNRRTFLSIVFFIILSLLLVYILLSCINVSSSRFFRIFSAPFKHQYFELQVMRYFCILVISSLAFSFAMKVGIFNIGISGQMLSGAISSYLLVYAISGSKGENGNFIFSDFPAVLGQFIVLIIGIIGGMVISSITALLKIYLKLHEVVTAIMLNWILLLVVGIILNGEIGDGNYQANTGMLSSYEMPPNFSLSNISSGISDFGLPWMLGITFVVTIVVWFLLKFTVFGHKLKTTGLSSTGAEYLGYNKVALQFISFAISGGLAGLLGVMFYTSQDGARMTFYLDLNVVPVEGFDGIAVGLVANNNPIAILFISLFLAIVKQGSGVVLQASAYSLITGILMYFVSIFGLLSFFKPWSYYYVWKYRKVNRIRYMQYEKSLNDLYENHKFMLSLAKTNFMYEKTKCIKNKFAKFILQIWYLIIGGKKVIFETNKLYLNFNTSKKEIRRQFKSDCVLNIVDYWEKNKTNNFANENIIKKNKTKFAKDIKLVNKLFDEINIKEFKDSVDKRIENIIF